MTKGRERQFRVARNQVIIDRVPQTWGSRTHEPKAFRPWSWSLWPRPPFWSVEASGGEGGSVGRPAGLCVCAGGRREGGVAGNLAREVSTTLWTAAAKIPGPLPARTALRCHHKFGFTRAWDKSKRFL